MYGTALKIDYNGRTVSRGDAGYMDALEQRVRVLELALMNSAKRVLELEGAARATAKAAAAHDVRGDAAAALAAAIDADRDRVAALQAGMRERTSERWKQPMRLGPTRR